MQSSQITMSTPEGIALVLAVALLYLTIRLIPRLIAGKGAFLRPRELHERLERGQDLLLLDIRSPAEFQGETGHLAGAKNLPLEQLRAAITEPKAQALRAAPAIVTICRSDARAAVATRILRKAGFRDVRVLSGGISAWQAEGYPVEHG